MMWGGTAHTGGNGVCGPDCNFMFPGNTDTLFWGDSCRAPNCPYDWTEKAVGDPPGDRRGFGSCGPFTFYPGWSEQIDLAYVFGLNFSYQSSDSAIKTMQQRIDSVRKYFKNDHIPCGGSFSAIATVPKINKQLTIYPNPAADFITVETTGIEGNLQYQIFDLIGKQVSKGILKNSKQNTINISNLQEGLYLLNVWDGKEKYCRKFIKE